MRWDKGKGLTLVSDSGNIDLTRDAAIAVAMVRERLIADEIAGRCESNSEQFLAMEEPVRDAWLMAKVVQDLMINADLATRDVFDEHTVWAVFHLCEMVSKLRSFYLDPADEEVTT